MLCFACFVGFLFLVAAGTASAQDPNPWIQTCPSEVFNALTCAPPNASAGGLTPGMTPSWCQYSNPFITPQPPMQVARAEFCPALALLCVYPRGGSWAAGRLRVVPRVL